MWIESFKKVFSAADQGVLPRAGPLQRSFAAPCTIWCRVSLWKFHAKIDVLAAGTRYIPVYDPFGSHTGRTWYASTRLSAFVDIFLVQ
jgi:hypothetical protein